LLSDGLLPKVLYWHIIPSITSVILTAGFISLVIWAFRVSNPRWRYWLLFVPLIKGLVVLVNGARPWPVLPPDRHFEFGLGVRLWDPLNLISIPSAFDKFPRIPTGIEQVTIGVIGLLLVALVWRWVSLFAFYRSLRGEELHAEDAPHLFQVLDKMVNKMHTRYPKIAISDKPYILPCLIGVFKPTIIISPELAEESSENTLEAILAHELAHLKRHDNILHWIAVMLRDSLVLNPFVSLVFARIMIAKEQDCDHIAAAATGSPKSMAEAIVYAAAMARGKGARSLPGNMSEVSESISTGTFVKRRIDMLLLDVAARQQKLSWIKGSFVIILALFTFFVHISGTWPNPLPSPIIQF